MIVLIENGGKNWIPIASAIISFIAVCVAIISIWLQQWQYHKKREPIVSPATKSFNVELPDIGMDWETNTKIDGKFSKTSIPLYNFGGTTAHNISYSFRLVNLLSLEKQLEKNPMDDEVYAKIENVSYENDSFDLVVKQNLSARRFIGIRSFIRRSDLISPGEKIDINLPSYFIVLINTIYSIQHRFANFEIENPVLELTVKYSDVNNDKFKTKYRVTLDYQYEVKGKLFELEGIELSSNFVHEFVSKKKIR